MLALIFALQRLLVAGVRPDGTTKVRPIDNMAASGVNSATEVTEKLTCDTLDTLLESLKSMHRAAPGHSLKLYKADIDAAFRRVPLSPGGSPMNGPQHVPVAVTLYCAEASGIWVQ